MPNPGRLVDAPATAIDRGANSRVKSVADASAGSVAAAGSRMSRASRAVAPSGVTTTGLHSNSTSASPSRSTRPPLPAIASRVATNASISTVGRPRAPVSSGAPGNDVTRSRASSSLSGAMRRACRPSSSVAMPPSPRSTTWPKVGSRTTPMISSVPPGCCCSSRYPRGLISTSDNRCRMSAMAVMLWSGDSPSCTAPTSLLCSRPGPHALSTIGAARLPRSG